MVEVTDVWARGCVAWAAGPCRTGETTLAACLEPAYGHRDLDLADRGFPSSQAAVAKIETGKHFAWRVSSAWKLRRSGRPLADGTWKAAITWRGRTVKVGSGAAAPGSAPHTTIPGPGPQSSTSRPSVSFQTDGIAITSASPAAASRGAPCSRPSRAAAPGTVAGGSIGGPLARGRYRNRRCFRISPHLCRNRAACRREPPHSSPRRSQLLRLRRVQTPGRQRTVTSARRSRQSRYVRVIDKPPPDRPALNQQVTQLQP